MIYDKMSDKCNDDQKSKGSQGADLQKQQLIVGGKEDALNLAPTIFDRFQNIDIY